MASEFDNHDPTTIANSHMIGVLMMHLVRSQTIDAKALRDELLAAASAYPDDVAELIRGWANALNRYAGLSLGVIEGGKSEKEVPTR